MGTLNIKHFSFVMLFLAITVSLFFTTNIQAEDGERDLQITFKVVYGFDKQPLGIDLYLAEVPVKFIPIEELILEEVN